MSKFPDRSKTALLVIDVQNEVVKAAHERDATVSNIRNLVEKARADGAPVVWVQHSDEELARGSDAWQIVAELAPRDDEPIIGKSFGDAFEETTLEDELARLGVGRLVVAGAETDACIRSTLHGAIVRGYDTLLVADAHTTNDLTAWGYPPPGQVIVHTNLYWTNHRAPGRSAGIVATTDVEFT